MEYQILEAASAAELQQKVTERIADGWMPTGGVAVWRSDFGPAQYAQAVVWLPDDEDEAGDE